MKRGYTLLVILSIGMAKADFYYNPYNSNPTRHDVWAAEQNALMHNSRAADAVNDNAAWEERKMADQAQRDADTMRRRMHENEWQEQMRQAEADRHRREKEQRQAIEANQCFWKLQEKEDVWQVNGNQDCRMVQEQREHLIKSLQPTPYPYGVDRPGYCFFCGARLLGRQRQCSRCSMQGPPKQYYEWKSREQQKAAVLKELLGQ